MSFEKENNPEDVMEDVSGLPWFEAYDCNCNSTPNFLISGIDLFFLMKEEHCSYSYF